MPQTRATEPSLLLSATYDCVRVSSLCRNMFVHQAQAIRAIYSAYVNEWPSGQLQAQYFEHVPVALWLTPDVAYVGLSESDAVKRYGASAVGTSRADYSSTIKYVTGIANQPSYRLSMLTSAQINLKVLNRYCVTPRPGFVKLVYLLDGGRIVGAHLFGEDTTEMVCARSSLTSYPSSSLSRAHWRLRLYRFTTVQSW